MFLSTALERRIALTASKRLLFMSTASALSIATSVPAPMAMPRSACARAGASLMPSPIIATRWPSAWSFLMCSALFSGRTPAMTLGMSMRRRMASAVRALSPVSMTTSMPIARKRAMASRLVAFSTSAAARMPITRSSSAKISGVQPSSASEARCASYGVRSIPFSAMSLSLPAA